MPFEMVDTSSEQAGLASVDLVLSLIERLAATRQLPAMSDLARELGTSKARIHRHLRPDRPLPCLRSCRIGW
jgi:hypothetical protein